MMRPTIRGIRLRLALALLLVVAGALGVVYLIVVPSLEAELVSAKLDQLEDHASTLARGYQNDLGSLSEQVYAEAGASVIEARVVIYAPLEQSLLVLGDSDTSSSLDVERDPIALRAVETGKRQSGTRRPRRPRVRRGGRSRRTRRAVILLSDCATSDTLSSVDFVQRQLLVAGLIGLLFAAVAGYALAVDARTPDRPARACRGADRRRAARRAGRRHRPRRARTAGGRVRADARSLAEPRSSPERVHRQRLARAAHAALLARRLPRADGGRGARREDAAGVSRDDARAGRPARQARDRSARPLAARRGPDARRARARRSRGGRADGRGGVPRGRRAAAAIRSTSRSRAGRSRARTSCACSRSAGRCSTTRSCTPRRGRG